MKIEIDQSGRVEYTSTSTVIGDSNGNSILIRSIDKQYLQKIFRSIDRPQMFVLETFSILVALLIKTTYSPTHIYIIDKEYFGHEDVIRGLVKKHLRKMQIDIETCQIDFALIGKKSKAHDVVYARYKRKKKGVIITAGEMIQILLP